MNHPHTLEFLASARQSDLLAEARHARLVRFATASNPPPTRPHPRPRLRYGMATILVATSAALAVLVRPF